MNRIRLSLTLLMTTLALSACANEMPFDPMDPMLEGARLVIVGSPAVTVSTPFVFVTWTSATRRTSVKTTEVLLPGLKSSREDVTVAVFVSVSGASARTTQANV